MVSTDTQLYAYEVTLFWRNDEGTAGGSCTNIVPGESYHQAEVAAMAEVDEPNMTVTSCQRLGPWTECCANDEGKALCQGSVTDIHTREPHDITSAHAAMVTKLFKDPRTIDLPNGVINLLHAAVGVAGEGGEILDIVKKVAFNGRDIPLDKLINEMGDIEFYLQALREALGVSRDDTLAANMEKLGKRYEGFVYSDEAAAARKDEVE